MSMSNWIIINHNNLPAKLYKWCWVCTTAFEGKGLLERLGLKHSGVGLKSSKLVSKEVGYYENHHSSPECV